MPYYSTYFRKLLGKDSPSGRPLSTRRRPLKRPIKQKVKARKIRVKAKPRAEKKRIVKRVTRRRGPTLTITHKKKPKAKKPLMKAPLRRAKTGLSLMSKKRRGQLRMRPSDIYEKRMVGRLTRKTGMTHIQVMNLVQLGKKSDYIDIETEIEGLSGLSKRKEELYEFGKRKLTKLVEREKPASKRYEVMGKKELKWELGKYEHQYNIWLRSQKKVNLI